MPTNKIDVQSYLPVVALCGPPGSGKSALAQALCKRLEGSVLVDMDDHQSFTQQSPQDMQVWMQKGSDYNDFCLDDLAVNLATLAAAKQADEPPSSVVIFETHFGRAHRATGQHIDVMVWLDLPLDVTLARNIGAICEQVLAGPIEPEAFAWLQHYTQVYEKVVRSTLTVQRQKVRPEADIILDATKTLDELQTELMLALSTLLGTKIKR